MPLDDDQLRAIGRITVQAAELEYSMHLVVCTLVNPSNINIGRLAFAKDQFDSLHESSSVERGGVSPQPRARRSNPAMGWEGKEAARAP